MSQTKMITNSDFRIIQMQMMYEYYCTIYADNETLNMNLKLINVATYTISRVLSIENHFC